MASATTATYAHHAAKETKSSPRGKASDGTIRVFLRDLGEDLRRIPLAADTDEKHDLFREHINAMAICYFALILLLTAGSLPVLAWMIRY